MHPNINDLILSPESTLIDALRVINNGTKGLALVADAHGKLMGLLTDGDIRRSILSGETLEASVTVAMNTSFKSISPETSEHQSLTIMRRHDLRHLPVVDGNNALKNVVFLDALLHVQHLPNPVVIMAGGKGTRLLPHTLNCPKPMLTVGGQPMLEILIEQCVLAGFKQIFISVNYLKNKIIDYFGDGQRYGAQITYLVEDKPLGTAGSLQLLPQDINTPFLVMNGDVLTHLDFSHLIDYHQTHEGVATICGREHQVKIPFGVIKHEGAELVSLEEKPSLNFLVNAGLYVLDPEILQLMIKDQYLDMPSLLLAAQCAGLKVNVCPVHEYWLDVGRPETLEQAHKEWISAA